MSNSDHTKNGDEDAAERALREGLRAPALSPEAMQRIRAAAQQEWRAHYAGERCAPPSPLAVDRRCRLGGGIRRRRSAGMFSWRTPRTRRSRSARSRVSTRRASWNPVTCVATSAGRGCDAASRTITRRSWRLAGHARGRWQSARGARLAIEVLAANAVKLERGELYVDIPPGSRGSDRFMVVTPPASSAMWARSSRWPSSMADPPAGARRQRAVARDRRRFHGRCGYGSGHRSQPHVTRRSIATAGRDWAWAESMAPDFEIENRPLQEFLEWFSRETGRKLVTRR